MQRFTKPRWLAVLSVTTALAGCNALPGPGPQAESPEEIAPEASTASATEARGAALEQADATDAELADDELADADAEGARADVDTADEDDAVDEPEVDPALELAADQADELAAEPADEAANEAANDGTPELDDEAWLDSEEAPDSDTEVATTAASGAGDAAALQDALAKLPTPIRFVLILVKENHTFDNYFTGFPDAASSTHAFKFDPKTKRRVRILRPIAPPDQLPTGPGHTHAKALAAYRNGHMDGFSVNPGKTPYIRYTKQQIPSYWKYASEFVLADHMFSTTLGPSSPGHEVFWFGRSTTLDNPRCNLPGGKGCGSGCLGSHLSATTFNPTTGTTRTVKPCFDLPSLPDHLPAGFTWFDYGGQHAKQIKSQAHVSPREHYGSTAQLLRDLRAGKLHNLMIAHVTGDVSEHPKEGPCKGERFTVEAVNAAMQLPQWKHMAIVVTWDDWGGFYDHVKPPVRKARNGKRFGSGFRLPLIVISPFAKHGVVLHHQTEQASVPRLVEELWGMKFMTARNAHARDGIAGSLLGAFDFAQKPRAPLLLARRSCPGD
ncbi:MAG TPA: alkaline phosphatase family protein [Kofleriaceae bacterium]|nr:alkaline phosphatase family protein [Kofleriaceae bacterium]